MMKTFQFQKVRLKGDFRVPSRGSSVLFQFQKVRLKAFREQ